MGDKGAAKEAVASSQEQTQIALPYLRPAGEVVASY